MVSGFRETAEMSTLEKLISALLTPGVLTWVLTSYAGVVTFFLKSFDKRIRALEDGKADVSDLESMQALLQQLIESQDRRTARMEGMINNLMMFGNTISQVPSQNSRDINNIAKIVRGLAEEVEASSKILKKLTDEG